MARRSTNSTAHQWVRWRAAVVVHRVARWWAKMGERGSVARRRARIERVGLLLTWITAGIAMFAGGRVWPAAPELGALVLLAATVAVGCGLTHLAASSVGRGAHNTAEATAAARLVTASVRAGRARVFSGVDYGSVFEQLRRNAGALPRSEQRLVVEDGERLVYECDRELLASVDAGIVAGHIDSDNNVVFHSAAGAAAHAAFDDLCRYIKHRTDQLDVLADTTVESAGASTTVAELGVSHDDERTGFDAQRARLAALCEQDNDEHTHETLAGLRRSRAAAVSAAHQQLSC